MGLINKYIKLTKFEKLIFINAFFTSIKVRFNIKFFKMPYYVENLGEKGKQLNTSEFNAEIVKIIIINVKRVSKYSFWRTKCFEEAYTAKLLMKKQNIKSTIFFGVKKDEQGSLNAHSWLKIGNNCIIGCNGIDKYTVTQFFT